MRRRLDHDRPLSALAAQLRRVRAALLVTGLAALAGAAVLLMAGGGPAAAQDASADASLWLLDVPGHSLTPAFTPERTDYTVTIKGLGQTFVEARATDRDASIAVSGGRLLSPGYYYVGLQPRPERITVTVTATDGTTTRTYTIRLAEPDPEPTPQPVVREEPEPEQSATQQREQPQQHDPQPADNEAGLSGLAVVGDNAADDGLTYLTDGGLRPAFDAETTTYWVTLNNLFATGVRITPTAKHTGAAITVDGQSVSSGSKSGLITLSNGAAKAIAVVVTAADGATKRTYTVNAVLHPSARLSGLTLSPDQGSITSLSPRLSAVESATSYAARASHATSRVTITPRFAEAGSRAVITVNGAAYTSGAVDLKVGANPIKMKVTAVDGYTTRSYTFTLTRLSAAASSDARLSKLEIYRATHNNPNARGEVGYDGSAYALTPAFDPQVTQYTVRVPHEGAALANQVTLIPTAAAGGLARFSVAGEGAAGEAREPTRRPGNGETSGPWNVGTGYVWLDVTVTAPDLTTTKTYTVKLVQDLITPPRRVRLTPGPGQLELSWSWDADTGPEYFFARWRKSGETAWLNRGGRGIFGSRLTGPAGGAWVGSSSQVGAEDRVLEHRITGLDDGAEYEVQIQGFRGGGRTYGQSGVPDERKDDWLLSAWVTLRATPGKTGLTITPSAPTRVYGGTDDLGYTVSGLSAGDAAADVLTGALARAAGSDAGRYAISLGTLALAAAYADKYALPSAPAVTSYLITPRPITAVGGVAVESRAADGTTDASFDTSSAVGAGVLAAELADFRAGGLRVAGAFAAATAGTHDVSAAYSLHDQGAFKAANYRLSAPSATLSGELTAAAPACACQPGIVLFTDALPAEGAGPVAVMVGLSRPAGPGGLTVTLTAGGTAGAQDYTLAPTRLAIAEGVTGGRAALTIADDALDDDGETIVLSAAASGSQASEPLTLTIRDNDDASATEATQAAVAVCGAPAGGDYDADDDGLIEVCSLAQLNAVRWDPDGDGSASEPGYRAAFPAAAAGMGCPASGCRGYELTRDLDFDTNANGRADAGDAFWNGSQGWVPVDFGANDAETVFEGNGRTIRNFYSHQYVRRSIDGISLFGTVSAHGVIRNLGMVAVDNVSSHNPYVAGLVGINYGTIRNSYATGKVSGQNSVGGLVGALRAPGRIIGSYAAVTTTGRTDDVGGLVGATEGGAIIASYATGAVSAQGDDAGGLLGEGSTSDRIVASYATGDVSGRVAVGGLVGHSSGSIVASFATGDATGREDVGGLAGYVAGSVRASYATGSATGRREVGGLIGDGYHVVTTSYWDIDTSGNARSSDGAGQTSKDLKRPTGYEGIFADWNLDLDGDGAADDPWDFGSWCEYPALKYGGLSPEAQRAPCKPTDYDTDDDGLIEVSTLAQLDVVRYDLDGDGQPGQSSGGVEAYAAAFPGAPSGAMGCPASGCRGYELVRDLDFDTNGNGRADAGDAYWNGGAGWTPIGYMVPPEGLSKHSYGAVFEGNGHAIRNLFVDTEHPGAGLFDILTARPNAIIRNLRLESVNVSGKQYVGGLVGENQGTISGVSVSGRVSGRNAVGGLAGKSSGLISASRSTAAVTGESPRSAEGRDVGGLVGRNEGKLRSSSASGAVSGQANNTGGLVGYSARGSRISASYATGDASSAGSYVGGLVGSHWGAITASYATGNASGAGAGGLVGYHGGSVANSYWDADRSQAPAVGVRDARASGAAGAAKTTAELQAPTGYTGIYAAWNFDLDGDGRSDDPWAFGTAAEYPALR